MNSGYAIPVTGASGENILHMGDFPSNFAEEVINKWMKLSKKKLTNFQGYAM